MIDLTSGEKFRHPAGLATLFLTEMWERLAFYGMRAILVLFLVAPAARGGLALDDRSAALIYGLAVSLFTLLGVPAGWLGDRLIGGQRAVVAGGSLMVVGLSAMAYGATGGAPQWLFFGGLFFEVAGMALLKINANVIVAELYPQGGSQRDAGFSIYYMGINLGALLGTVVVPLAAQRYGWSAGFGVAAAGITLGVAQFLWTRRRLGQAGRVVAEPLQKKMHRPMQLVGTAFLAALLLLGWMLKIGFVSLEQLARGVATSIFVVGGCFVVYLLFANKTSEGRKRVIAMLPLCAGVAIFMAGFDQAGSSLNLFAERFTARTFYDFEVPAGLLQSAFPLGVTLFAPVFAVLWYRLGRAGIEPSALTKYGFGLVLLSAGFQVVSFAAHNTADSAGLASPNWLLTTYLLHTFADLCIGPVGFSASTKVASPRMVAQFVALFSVGVSAGHSMSGYLAGGMDTHSLGGLSTGFHETAMLGLGGAVMMFALAPVVRRMLGRHIQF